MKTLLLVMLLVPSLAFAKPKPTKVERAEMFEGQLLDAQLAQMNAEIKRAQAEHQARVIEFQARLKTQYGIDLVAGDKVDLMTGTIIWHTDKKVAEAKP